MSGADIHKCAIGFLVSNLNSKSCKEMQPTTEWNLGIFYLHIWKISKVTYKTTLSDVCCQAYAVQNMHFYNKFMLSACWALMIALSFTGVLHDRFFLENNFSDFPHAATSAIQQLKIKYQIFMKLPQI